MTTYQSAHFGSNGKQMFESNRLRPASRSRAKSTALGASLAAALMLSAGATSAQALTITTTPPDPKPFGNSCELKVDNIRHCPAKTLDQRVPSFDGVPIDADVTLPASDSNSSGPYPLIVMLHGYGGTKLQFQSQTVAGDTNPRTSFNNLYYAARGYAVINYSARGNGNSCGEPASRTGDCEKGWSHLADQRYEVRDLQHMVGVLVDQGFADPNAIGMTGVSYGGSQVLQVGFMNGLVRQTDGNLSEWRSPNGTPLRAKAIFPRETWFDLAGSLTPNGRGLSTITTKNVGIKKKNFVDFLFSSASGARFDPPTAGLDPTADLAAWKNIIDAGEPYDQSAVDLLNQMRTYKSPMGLAGKSNSLPAMLLQTGWTDDLFPFPQALATYKAALKADPNAQITFQLGDLGHPRGTNRQAERKYFNEQAASFFDANLKGVGAAPPANAVYAYEQSCKTLPTGSAKLLTLNNISELSRKSVTIKSKSRKTIDSKGGDLGIATALSALLNVNSCVELEGRREKGTIKYTSKSRKSVTVAGQTAVTMKLRTSGGPGQLALRMWDIAPNGNQVLIDRGVYRLTKNQTGTVKFLTQGNLIKVAKGHRIAIQVLGRDTGYLAPSKKKFKVKVRSIQAKIPTR